MYNHLHLPTSVVQANGSKLEMVYDAEGNLLIKKIYGTAGNLIETRNYINGIEFSGTTVMQMNHSQGRVQNNGGTYRHEYTISDHLGNTRILYYNNSNIATIIDENHYYAYGLEFSGFEKFNGTSDYKYKFNGIEREENFKLDFAFYRTLDPVLGVWLQVDPKAEAMMDMSPYCAMGNNPISYSDPEGDIAVLAIAAYAAIGVTVNGVGNTLKGDPFFQGWAGAAVAGALSGGYGAAAISGLNNHLPSYNVNLGGGFSVGISPGIIAGSQGFSLGGNVSVGYTSGNFSIGVGGGFGYSNMNYGGNIGKIAEWSGRISGGVVYNTSEFSVGLSSNYFGGTANNRTGQLSASYGDFRVSYENDGTPFQKVGLGGGTDGYRTAAVTIGWKDFSLGTRIFTGMRDYSQDSPRGEASPGYPYGCTTNKECNDYKSGVLYLGYKNQRAGIDHYKIGHAFQNVLAHTWASKQQRLPWTENNYGKRANRFYGGTFFNNPFSNW